MKLIFELSGENPTLPFAELGCVGTVLDQRLQVAVAECANPSECCRLAMTHRVLEYLGECDPDLAAFERLLRDLSLETRQAFSGRVKKIHEGSHRLNPCSQKEFERMIGTMVAGPVSLKNPEVEYRAILSEDRCYFGKVLFAFDRGASDARNPGKRVFFHPGVMMPRMARTLVNIAGVRKGGTLLDPFCGTGGILIEADLLGAFPAGSDFDPAMIAGSRQNSAGSDLMLADATLLPFRDHSIDAVVTDFPYGQSVCIKKTDTMDTLYGNALEEICRVLKAGKRAVVVTHRDISAIAADSFTILQRHEQRVHKSLTRRILVLGNQRECCV
ncbi:MULTISPECIES: methyltransferase domain-containing protein [unclassified Methanoregula]|uniref:methyltransferase domain-containing protein n=1 Tax=unclassified Methanoregula TaxID=2649730 RepID=UPI0009D1C797|nr:MULTISPECIES: methyltransferase domain-containing protein [unclassified Methanoregula]OPX62672.1 MAG: tRNA (guanine(10)-N2)-dimethyltransferase [Methanoregula sp. PtaB.Bin085]OPY37247.1 MAG: tRNA (guanine(10)-N2)-dimethyltransferase [Methanoregula sp. PtaU1.Bin006]